MLIGCITLIAFLPHTLKALGARPAVDVSLVMFLLAATSVVLWLVYGIASGNSAIIIINGAMLFLAGSVLSVKLFVPRKKGPTNEELLAQLITDEN